MRDELVQWAEPGHMDRAADPAQYVVRACEQAKQWLAIALEDPDADQISEFKSQAEAIRVYTVQKQLGKETELSAAEIVRRAERGLGLAIRTGQRAGYIAGRDAGPAARVAKQTGDTSLIKPRPTDFAPSHELTSNGAGIYRMTDEVSDEEFEDALAEAKAEENLSRANVVRKIRSGKSRASGCGSIPEPGDRSPAAVMRRRELIRVYAGQGHSSAQMSELIGTSETTIRDIARKHSIIIPADEVMRKRRRIDSTRIVRETVHALQGLAIGTDLVDFDDLDTSELEDWAVSLSRAIRTLNRFTKQIKEMAP